MTDGGGDAEVRGLAELRARIRSLRSALGAAVLADRGRAAGERLLAAFHDTTVFSAWTVMSYRPLVSELNITPLNEALQTLGATLCFPSTAGQTSGQMRAVRIGSQTRWIRSAFGVEEPDGGDEQDPAQIDFILVPGLAFGPLGERIGFGAGHYDRFLPRAPRAIKVALTLDEQIQQSVPQNPWDQRVDWIVTPTREIRLPGVKQWSYHHSHAIAE